MDLHERACVRITIKENNTILKQGSGVIIFHENKYYVLTALHCFGETIPDINDIFIEYQEDYNSEFENIKVISIKDHCEEKDWALIEIDYENKVSGLNNIKLGYGFVKQENVVCYGYQSISNNQFRPFYATILVTSNDNKNFQINLSNDTFNQAGENGQYIAQGLSGSGVFLVKNRSTYLIGILTSVKTKNAWNDDINCVSVSNITEINNKIENLSDIDFLKMWDKNIENKKEDLNLKNYRSLNNDNFENLQRKNRIIYESTELADKKTSDDLIKHLALKENIDRLDNLYPELYKDFLRIVKKFQNTVEADYSITVNGNNEAKQTKIQLQNELKHDLERFLPLINIDLADYQIIEWLLNCSLNFKNK